MLLESCRRVPISSDSQVELYYYQVWLKWIKMWLACHRFSLPLWLTALGWLWRVTLATGAPVSSGPSGSSSSSRVLIWPDQIEDNALTEQNGDFVYKQWNELPEQHSSNSGASRSSSSSASIFFWPATGQYDHHSGPPGSSQPRSHSTHRWHLARWDLAHLAASVLWWLLTTHFWNRLFLRL